MMSKPVAAPADAIEQALALARQVLPDQGPLGVFVHHNTLHAFQHLPFHEGVQQGAALLGARPYLELEAFRAAYRQGRIEDADLAHALRLSLGDAGMATAPVAFGRTRFELRRLLLTDDPAHADYAGFHFRLTAGLLDAAEVAHHAACVDAVTRVPPPPSPAPAPVRHRDMLFALAGVDTDVTVMRELVRLCAAYLDQGQILQTMPGREHAFLRAVAELYAAGGSAPRGAPGVASDFARIAALGLSARAVIEDVLLALDVAGEAVVPWLLGSVTALAGWAGMFARFESHPEDADGVPATLIDYLAVRLVFERRAIERECGERRLPVGLAAMRARLRSPEAAAVEQAALRLWALSAAAGMSAADIAALDDDELARLWQESGDFPELARRAVWQEAYEGWYRRRILDALAARRAAGPIAPRGRAAAQFMFCIDEREESLRRAIEEQGLEFETFGGAGFFGVAVDYQGLYDTAPAAHYPVVVTPEHEVREAPLASAADWHVARERLRGIWNALHRGAHRGSRTLSGGAGLSLLFGPLAVLVALARVVLPRTSLDLLGRLARHLFPRPATRLAALRADSPEARSARGKLLGFSLTEAADRVAGMLRASGLANSLAPIVVVLGHGSTSLNNPHESAHDCGACGGRRGGANARLFAAIANRPEVRAAVRERGVEIPADTWFIGGLHDTADDGVHYYDLEDLPAAAEAAFARADQVLQVARQRSAQERCRRFHHAPLGLSPAEALRHVEGRAAHFGQPRPEYGHCTNAIAVVGRRALTRGLHLDRRPFLISYDPAIDTDGSIVERTLAAVGPVGA
ncbi:MAG: putative inorganic carbon transporter subunit DabA, partial [Gammaproteobacteria bacterium]